MKTSDALRLVISQRIPAAEVFAFLVAQCGPGALESINSGPARRYVAGDIARRMSMVVATDGSEDRTALLEAAAILEAEGQ